MHMNIFQTLVRRWCVRASGEQVADDRAERTHRFLEEALELAQATDCTQEQAHMLVEYVYGRPVGKPQQEVGGTMVTLAALCAARGMDMAIEAAAELSRINRPEVIERIRVKQAAKRHDIPLSPPQAPSPDMFCSTCTRMRTTYRATEGDSAAHGSICCGHCQRVLVTARTPPPGNPIGIPLDTKCIVTGETLGDVLESGHDAKQPICKPEAKRTYVDAIGTTGGKATVGR